MFLHGNFGLCYEFAVISCRFSVGPKVPFPSVANTKVAVEAVLLGAELLSGEIWIEGLVFAPIFL